MAKTLIPIITLLYYTHLYSQEINHKDLRAAIDTMAILIEKNYVFPDKGKLIAKDLLQSYKKGTYSKVKTWKELDSVLSKDLQKISNDGHMYIGYDPQIVKDLLNPPQENSEDPAEGLNKAIATNFGFKEVKVLDGNIGYFKVNKIDLSAESLPQLYAAMRFISNTKALIIDLSNNGGGGGEIGPVFESFFLPRNQTLLEFKSRSGHNTIEKTVGWLTEKRYDKPLYIIVNKKTASAAEAFTYALQYLKRAVVVGEGSAGAAHMNTWYPVNQHIYLSVSTAAPTIPGMEKSWENIGIKADIITDPGEEINAILKILKSK